jgi:hypothetical protein
MLFEAQLLFSYPTTIAASSAVLAPFFNLLLIAALLALLYFIFQTNLGRNMLGLIGGASLIDTFFMPQRVSNYPVHHHGLCGYHQNTSSHRMHGHF